jgi:DNA uptake protein ComE-like DNA-binding protein
MAAVTPVLQTTPPNRRRRVRHKIQTPAFASFAAESQGAIHDLHEVVDVSEDGVAIQCSVPLEVNRRVDLCLDLAEASGSIYTTGQVIWSSESGRCGLRFSGLAPDSLLHLREWLFLNAMTGVANAEAEGFPERRTPAPEPVLRPNYTDTLAAVTAVQRQVESLGSDLVAALQLVAARAQTLVRASGAAIALATENPNVMFCRASSGPDSPPVGAPLQVGSGFSGACVREGRTLRCDDTESDSRVDRESCRALGIRSILATPVRVGEKTVGILEVFSPHDRAFADDDSNTLQRLAETVLASVNRAARSENLAPIPTPAPFTPPAGGVLFASQKDKEDEPAKRASGAHVSGAIRLPRSYLILLISAAATIALTLGYELAPTIQAKLRASAQGTVLASSPIPSTQASPTSAAPAVSVATATVQQLRQMAESGDATAQNALGLRYATGDGVALDETEAVRWFMKAAEQGSVSAQSKLGSLFWAGRGVPASLNQAYFWTVLARAGGNEASKVLAPQIATHMTPAQARAIEQQAENWLEQHSTVKPAAGR